jgi:phosphatidylglycerophosphate synthase
MNIGIELKKIWNLRAESNLWTSYISQPLAVPMVYFAYKLKLKPNFITTLSLFSSIIGIVFFAISPTNLINIIAAGIFFQISYSLDCADGMLARFVGNTSHFGAWYDLVLDRINHIIIICSLMIIMRPLYIDKIDYLPYSIFFGMLLLTTITFANAVNLKMVMFPKKENTRDSNNKINASRIIKKFLTNLYDYGFFLFILFLGILIGKFFLIGVILIFLYFIALLGLILKTWLSNGFLKK